MRTGSGAMDNNPTWPLYKRGLGPTSTEMFMQSNYGIVTKMGYWLMPKPEVYMPLWLQRLGRRADARRGRCAARAHAGRHDRHAPAAVEHALHGLDAHRPRGVVHGEGPMPEEIIDKIAKEIGTRAAG